MPLVSTRGLIVIEGLHRARASISEVILQTSLDRSRENGKRCNFINKVCYLNLRSVVVSVALYLRCEYVPLPLVGAPVRRVQLDRDSSLDNIILENMMTSELHLATLTVEEGSEPTAPMSR